MKPPAPSVIAKSGALSTKMMQVLLRQRDMRQVRQMLRQAHSRQQLTAPSLPINAPKHSPGYFPGEILIWSQNGNFHFRKYWITPVSTPPAIPMPKKIQSVVRSGSFVMKMDMPMMEKKDVKLEHRKTSKMDVGDHSMSPANSPPLWLILPSWSITVISGNFINFSCKTVDPLGRLSNFSCALQTVTIRYAVRL